MANTPGTQNLEAVYGLRLNGSNKVLNNNRALELKVKNRGGVGWLAQWSVAPLVVGSASDGESRGLSSVSMYPR